MCATAGVGHFDFDILYDEPVTAIADGYVLRTYDKTKPGDPCHGGSGEACVVQANYTLLLHGDGTTSAYRHLSRPTVQVGEFVSQGETVGLAGVSGWVNAAPGTAIFHVQRNRSCNAQYQPEDHGCPSISTAYDDVPGDGIPSANEYVTSKNCP